MSVVIDGDGPRIRSLGLTEILIFDGHPNTHNSVWVSSFIEGIMFNPNGVAVVATKLLFSSPNLFWIKADEGLPCKDVAMCAVCGWLISVMRPALFIANVAGGC